MQVLVAILLMGIGLVLFLGPRFLGYTTREQVIRGDRQLCRIGTIGFGICWLLHVTGVIHSDAVETGVLTVVFGVLWFLTNWIIKTRYENRDNAPR